MIQWKVFIDALKHQQPSTLDIWLRRWLFTNEGVITADSTWANNSQAT